MNLIHIGTSGWSYSDWVGKFYPQHMKSADFIKYYSENFDTVEVNSSFYHTLKNKTVLHWKEEVPERFIFALKADRYITHIKKLEEPEKTLPGFLESASLLQKKLGPILFQLSPSFGFNAERLKNFVNTLTKDFTYVFEFRNKTWFNDETYEILKKKNIALCIYNLNGYQSPLEVCANFIYIRFHGTKGIGVGKYSKQDIETLSEYIKTIVSQNKNVYCYFNNNTDAAAIVNARELKASL